MDRTGHNGRRSGTPRPGVLLVVSFVVFGVTVLSAVSAHAELVFFSSGRSLSVTGHRREGASLVLWLRGGGEIVCEGSVVARIEPDEVPYPEPEAARPAPPLQAVDVAAPFGAIIDAVAAAHGVNARLVRAVIQVESGYQPHARSMKGAMGLMQLMPDTARQYAVSDPYDPRANIEAGVKHLRSLLQRFSLTMALAAYNAGEAAVQRFGGVPPYPETRDYVKRIVELFGQSHL